MPAGVAFDAAGNTYICDFGNNAIRRIAPAVPTLTAFAPASGTPGTLITLTGTNFLGITDVRFGGVSAAYNVISATQIEAFVPAGGITGNITVTNAGGTASLGTFTVIPSPVAVVSPVLPASAPPAPPSINTNPLTGIEGVPFAQQLRASGNPLPIFSLIGGTLPPGLILGNDGSLSGIPTQAGEYKIVVRAVNSLGMAEATIATVIEAARPIITGISSSFGEYGSAIVISGYNFSKAVAVSFGGVPALRFTINSDNQITAIVGRGDDGNVTVTSNIASGSIGGFTFSPPPQPSIQGIAETSILSGDDNYTITVRGSNFPEYAEFAVDPTTASVSVNGSGLRTVPRYFGVVQRLSSSEAVVSLPLASRTIGAKRLVLLAGRFETAIGFEITPAPAPRITTTNVVSTTASGQAFSVLLSGSGFHRNGIAAITINGDAASATVLSSTQAVVTIPSWRNRIGGLLRLRLTNFDGQLTEATVRVISRPPPFISSVIPQFLPDGRLRFVLQGVNFQPSPLILLQFTTLPVISFSPTEVIVEVPRTFPLPKLSEESLVLLLENIDGQRYGIRVSPRLFYQATSGMVSGLAEKFTAQMQSLSSMSDNTSNDGVASIGAASGEVLFSEISVFPNPVQDVVNIAGIQALMRGTGFAGTSVTIINSAGARVFEQSLQSPTNELSLNVQQLPQGAYVLVLKNGTTQHISRFIKE